MRAPNKKQLDVCELFPATRFYGSKRKHLSWMQSCLKDLAYSSALDLFGGTATVSMLFESLGKNVFYHDSAHFNYRQAKGFFGHPKKYDFDDIEMLLTSVGGVTGFIAKNFKGQYFTDQENRWLDGYLKMEEALRSQQQRDVLFYCVAQACLQKRPFNLFHRKNLHLRLKEERRTFGNAVTWERSFSELAQRHLFSVKFYVENVRGQGGVQVIKPTTPTTVAARADLVYLDPPYIRADRHTESYTKRYHFLDGLSSPRKWSLEYEEGESDYFQPYSMREPWSDKSAFLDLLSVLLEKHRGSIVVMSYMDGGYPSATQLRKFFKSYFAKVRVFKRDVQRALSNQSGGEILIVGE